MRLGTRRAFCLAAQHIRDHAAACDGDGAPSERPPSSARPERVLLAVAPMRSMVVERERESEEQLEAARGGALARRLQEQWCGTDERMLAIERRTDAICRMQRGLEGKLEEVGEGLRREVREACCAMMAAAAGAARGAAASPGAAGGEATLDGAAAGGGGGGGATPAATGGGSAVRRRVNNLARASPCIRAGRAADALTPTRRDAGSPSKGLAPSARRHLVSSCRNPPPPAIPPTNAVEDPLEA